MTQKHWKLTLATLSAFAVALVAGNRPVEAADVAKDADDARVVAGYRMAPVPLQIKRGQERLVGLGSYLVNAGGGCNDCHTNPPYAPGGDPFLGEPGEVNADGYLAGGVQFGPFTSRNLTPDATGKPAGLTFAQFRETIRTGRDLKQAHPEISPLLQVMPWPVYRNLTNDDLRAIYAYLRAIPSIQN